jgi:hypothetical protein
MKTKEDVLKTLDSLKAELTEKFKVEKIGLFGSFARGEQQGESDVDVLVEFSDDADLFDLVRLSLYLEEQLQRKVDVVTHRALRDEMRMSVLQEVSFL